MMQKDNMDIILMTKDHLDDVYMIEKDSFTHPWSFENLKAELDKDDSYLYVATKDDKVVGYIGVNIIENEGYLLNVAVDSEYRNQKIATNLFDKLFELAKDKKLAFITLEVRESNIAAINLYDKLGFKKVATRKAYYKAPLEDAILMTKYFEEL